MSSDEQMLAAAAARLKSPDPPLPGTEESKSSTADAPLPFPTLDADLEQMIASRVAAVFDGTNGPASATPTGSESSPQTPSQAVMVEDGFVSEPSPSPPSPDGVPHHSHSLSPSHLRLSPSTTAALNQTLSPASSSALLRAVMELNIRSSHPPDTPGMPAAPPPVVTEHVAELAFSSTLSPGRLASPRLRLPKPEEEVSSLPRSPATKHIPLHSRSPLLVEGMDAVVEDTTHTMHSSVTSGDVQPAPAADASLSAFVRDMHSLGYDPAGQRAALHAYLELLDTVADEDTRVGYMQTHLLPVVSTALGNPPWPTVSADPFPPAHGSVRSPPPPSSSSSDPPSLQSSAASLTLAWQFLIEVLAVVDEYQLDTAGVAAGAAALLARLLAENTHPYPNNAARPSPYDTDLPSYPSGLSFWYPSRSSESGTHPTDNTSSDGRTDGVGLHSPALVPLVASALVRSSVHGLEAALSLASDGGTPGELAVLSVILCLPSIQRHVVTPLLIQQLSCDDTMSRRSAVIALGALGEEASEALPALDRVLQAHYVWGKAVVQNTFSKPKRDAAGEMDGGWDRRLVAGAMFSIGRAGRDVVCYHATHHPLPAVRKACVWVVGRKPAVPSIVTATAVRPSVLTTKLALGDKPSADSLLAPVPDGKTPLRRIPASKAGNPTHGTDPTLSRSYVRNKPNAPPAVGHSRFGTRIIVDGPPAPVMVLTSVPSSDSDGSGTQHNPSTSTSTSKSGTMNTVPFGSTPATLLSSTMRSGWGTPSTTTSVTPGVGTGVGTGVRPRRPSLISPSSSAQSSHSDDGGGASPHSTVESRLTAALMASIRSPQTSVVFGTVASPRGHPHSHSETKSSREGKPGVGTPLSMLGTPSTPLTPASILAAAHSTGDPKEDDTVADVVPAVPGFQNPGEGPGRGQVQVWAGVVDDQLIWNGRSIHLYVSAVNVITMVRRQLSEGTLLLVPVGRGGGGGTETSTRPVPPPPPPRPGAQSGQAADDHSLRRRIDFSRLTPSVSDTRPAVSSPLARSTPSRGGAGGGGAGAGVGVGGLAGGMSNGGRHADDSGDLPFASEQLGAVSTALQDSDPIVRSEACRSMGELGLRGLLRAVLSTTRSNVSAFSAALRHLSPDAPPPPAVTVSQLKKPWLTSLRRKSRASFTAAIAKGISLKNAAPALTPLRHSAVSRLSVPESVGATPSPPFDPLLCGKGGRRYNAGFKSNAVWDWSGGEMEYLEGLVHDLPADCVRSLALPVVTLFQLCTLDRFEAVRAAACWALGRLGRAVVWVAGSDVALSHMETALSDRFSKVRTAAAISVGQWGDAGSDLAVPLFHALRHNSVPRNVVACSLAQLGETGEKALRAVSHDRRLGVAVRVAAVGGLSTLPARTLAVAGRADPVVTSLTRASADPNPKLRVGALKALVRLSVRAKEQVPLLRLRQLLPLLFNALKDPCTPVRHTAGLCLTRVGPHGVLLMVEAVQHDSSPAVRAAAVKGLSLVGPRTVRVILAGLRDPHRDVVASASEALLSIGVAGIATELRNHSPAFQHSVRLELQSAVDGPLATPLSADTLRLLRMVLAAV